MPDKSTQYESLFQIWDLKNKRWLTEKVYGLRAIQFLNLTAFGRFIENYFLSALWFSKLYGFFQDLPPSKLKIAPFIQKFAIDMNEYQPAKYRSFNQFFIRQFKPGSRSFPTAPETIGCPSEGRVFVKKNASLHLPVAIKNVAVHVSELVGTHFPISENTWDIVIVRLCPTDYHRFHFHSEATIEGVHALPGKLHSVNPLAYLHNKNVLLKNERQITWAKNPQLGLHAYLEVGATCVGRITQTAALHKKASVFRGQEKGYFEFGGSTCVYLFSAGKVRWDEDLTRHSENGVECFVRLAKHSEILSLKHEIDAVHVYVVEQHDVKGG